MSALCLLRRFRSVPKRHPESSLGGSVTLHIPPHQMLFDCLMLLSNATRVPAGKGLKGAAVLVVRLVRHPAKDTVLERDHRCRRQLAPLRCKSLLVGAGLPEDSVSRHHPNPLSRAANREGKTLIFRGAERTVLGQRPFERQFQIGIPPTN